MTITTTNTEIRLSGTVTRSNMLALGSSHVDIVDGVFVKLKKRIYIDAGTILALEGLGIIVNNKHVHYSSPDASNNPTFKGVTFVYNIRSHWKCADLKLENCSILGCSKGGIFSITAASNVILSSVNNTVNPAGSEMFFAGGGKFSNVIFASTGRLGVTGAGGLAGLYWLKGVGFGSAAGAKIGYNSAPSTIFQDCKSPSNTFTIDTYLASDRNHTIMLLGDSIEAFYRGGTTFARTNAHGNTRLITGGVKFWEFLNSSNPILRVYDSRGLTSQKCVPTIENDWTLLETLTAVAPDAEGRVTFIVTSGVKSNTTNTTELTQVTGHKICVVDYGKELFVKTYDTVSSLIATEGTDDAPAPVVLTSDALITETDKVVVDAYTEITTAQEFYDRAATWLVDNYTGQTEGLVTRSGNVIDAGAYDVIIDRTATSPFSVSSTTITIKADTFSGDLQTTGTVTRANGAAISGSVKDANGVLFAVTGLPEGSSVGAWLASQGETNRTGIITSNNATLQLANNTEYFVIADAIGRVRSAPVRVNTANVSTLAIDLALITNALGTNLIPSQLTADQQTIADMFVYNQTDNRVDITLPSNYASNKRWDSSSSVWTFTAEDFFAVAWKVEALQSAASFLAVPRTVTIGSYALLLDTFSPLVLRQAQMNFDGAIINMARFQTARLGDDDQRNTFIDDRNGPVRVNAGNPVVATLSTPQSTLEAVVSQIPEQVNQSSLVRATAMNTQVL